MNKHHEISEEVIHKVASELFLVNGGSSKKEAVQEIKKYIANPETTEISEACQNICTISLSRYWNMDNDLAKMNESILEA